MDEAKLRYFKEQADALRTIQMFMFEDKGDLIYLDNLSLSYKEYSEDHSGIEVRLVRSKDDIIQGREEIFREILKSVDFQKNTVMFCFCKAGSKVGKHYHIQSERIYVLEGAQRDLLTGQVVTKNGMAHYPKTTPHKLEYLLDTALMVLIYPPI